MPEAKSEPWARLRREVFRDRYIHGFGYIWFDWQGGVFVAWMKLAVHDRDSVLC